MNVNLTKFSLADTTPQQVTGVLKTTGSTDADVLFAAKEEFGSTFATQRFQGLGLLIVGVLSSLTIIMAIIGIPVALFGFWMWRKGKRNVAIVEAAYRDYLAASGSANVRIAS